MRRRAACPQGPDRSGDLVHQPLAQQADRAAGGIGHLAAAAAAASLVAAIVSLLGIRLTSS